MSPQLRQKPKRFQIFRRHQLSQPQADPPPVIRPISPQDRPLIRQFFGELRVNK
jgi:hypothetical protein